MCATLADQGLVPARARLARCDGLLGAVD